MKVAALQQTLRELTQLLRSAGANSATVGELTQFVPALDKFADQTVKQFGDLLGRLDQSGSVDPKAGRGGGRAAKPKADPSTLAAEAAELYGRAADRSIPDDRYLKLFADLDGLDKKGLETVARQIEFQPPKAATKPKLVEAICSRIEDRRGATLRRNMLDRPAVAG